MKLIVAGQDALTPSEFAELAFGIDVELFAGADDETPSARLVRLDVAREVLRDLAPESARYAKTLMRNGERRRALEWKAAA